ncbi:nucleotidyltransferase family protein [Nocardioides sp. KIGAM211]|uniref:Nucleotidyltransferase family protein n=1 Tax=Nocardioides luti TaxID=2761101 RepID=A0A7X0RK31_9ACTN|nr:nucleotidyltransferase family protein [Nocardioides luti]
MISRVAHDAGVRALAIKGPILAEQRLRSSRIQSIDIDVLIPPSERDRFLRVLSAQGWHDQQAPDKGSILGSHAVSLANVRWPAELDVHVNFPGMLEDSETVFRELWRRRVTEVVGGGPVIASDPASSAIIAGLHLCRDGDQDGLTDLAGRIACVLSDQMRSDLKSLAANVGAMETLRPLLEMLGVDAPVARPSADLELWRLRVGAPVVGVPLIVDLMRSPWRSAPSVLARYLNPDDRELGERFPSEAQSPRRLNRLRLRRIAVGVISMPRAVIAARSYLWISIRSRSATLLGRLPRPQRSHSEPPKT